MGLGIVTDGKWIKGHNNATGFIINDHWYTVAGITVHYVNNDLALVKHIPTNDRMVPQSNSHLDVHSDNL